MVIVGDKGGGIGGRGCLDDVAVLARLDSKVRVAVVLSVFDVCRVFFVGEDSEKVVTVVKLPAVESRELAFRMSV